MGSSTRTPDSLDRRTLNRTLLARQGLLERTAHTVPAVIEQLVGMQAQEPIDPYVALWSRISDFDPAELSDLLEQRAAVRMGLQRTTLHLATARDALGLYPVMQDVLARAWKSSPFAKQLAGVDLPAVLDAARRTLEAEPRTPSELGALLGPSWPDRDAPSLAYAARFLLPLVQVPPRGLWRRTGRPRNTTLDAWLATPIGQGDPLDEILVRYLRAFGPATVADMRTWSWLTGLRPVVERLRPILRTYRDDAGRELFDVSDGVIADPDLPAPIRFLPQYDNVFLSHDDRSRLNGGMSWGIDFGWKGPILVDGFINGAWRIRRQGRRATMTVELGHGIDRPVAAAIEEEAGRLFAFLATDDETRDLRIVEAGAGQDAEEGRSH